MTRLDLTAALFNITALVALAMQRQWWIMPLVGIALFNNLVAARRQ